MCIGCDVVACPELFNASSLCAVWRQSPGFFKTSSHISSLFLYLNVIYFIFILIADRFFRKHLIINIINHNDDKQILYTIAVIIQIFFFCYCYLEMFLFFRMPHQFNNISLIDEYKV